MPALRPRTRLISASASWRTAACGAPRSASARRAARMRRASASAALAPAGCSRARRSMPAARSASSTPAAVSQCASASKSRRVSTRTPWCVSSVLTKSSQSRSPRKMNGRSSIGMRTAWVIAREEGARESALRAGTGTARLRARLTNGVGGSVSWGHGDAQRARAHGRRRVGERGEGRCGADGASRASAPGATVTSAPVAERRGRSAVR